MNTQLESVAASWQITVHTKPELFIISCDIWKIAKLAIVVGKKWHPHLQSQQYAHLEFGKMRKVHCWLSVRRDVRKCDVCMEKHRE